MRLALFDLDNTLLAGDSDHAWDDYLLPLVTKRAVMTGRYEISSERWAQRFRQWRDNSTFEQVLRHLHLRLREAGFINLETCMVDSTSIRATRADSGSEKKGAYRNRNTTVSAAAEAD